MKLRKMIVLSLLGVLLSTQSTSAQEYKFKALFLNKFTQYVQWPGENQELVIGVLGKSGVYDELVAVSKSNSKVKVIQIYNIEDYAQCDVVYVPSYMGVMMSQLSEVIGTKSVLVVSDDSTLVGKGADIGFYIENQRLLFMIDPKKMKTKLLHPSNRLISLGKIV